MNYIKESFQWDEQIITLETIDIESQAIDTMIISIRDNIVLVTNSIWIRI
jgi:polyribonucleotide nucleotidyltransferase